MKENLVTHSNQPETTYTFRNRVLQAMADAGCDEIALMLDDDSRTEFYARLEKLFEAAGPNLEKYRSDIQLEYVLGLLERWGEIEADNEDTALSKSNK